MMATHKTTLMLVYYLLDLTGESGSGFNVQQAIVVLSLGIHHIA